MKLKNFRAQDVHGYLRFDLNFDEHLAFLIGPNGSGKSTALQLIEALMTPSLRELAVIDFSFAEIEFEHSGKKTISVAKNSSEIVIRASWIRDSVIEVHSLDRKQRDLLATDVEAAKEFFANLTLELAPNPVFRGIGDLPAPVFLGIERQHKRDPRRADAPSLQTNLRAGHALRTGVAARRLFSGVLSAGLADTQLIIQEAYRNARRTVDGFQEKLRTDVLLSAFRYTDMPNGGNFERWSREDVRALEDSREEISEALSELGIDPGLVEERVGAFFERLTVLARKMESFDSSSDTILEFLTNQGHVDRLRALISLVQDFKRKSDRAFGRIHQFSDFINKFFADSGKHVVLDQIGRVVITRRDGRTMSIDALSSGERQLVIMSSHIFFNSFGARSKVYIIDEPELSLHMRWQEILVDGLTAAAPDAQFIFATHSPDIVGDNKKYCVPV